MKILSVEYRVLTMIPGVKSWGWFPENEHLSLERAREIAKAFRNGPSRNMRTKIIKTTETEIKS
jgi:phage anti-repressor protein